MALADFLPAVHALSAMAAATLAALVGRGQQVAAALDAVERGKATAIAVARDTVTALATDLAAFHAAYWDDLRYPPELFAALRDAESGLYRLLYYRRSWAVAQGLTSATSPGTAAPLDTRPLVPYLVRGGDTLERLAQRMLGAATRSWEIIDLNDLRAPFLDTADPPAAPASVQVKRIGDLLYLPPDATVPSAEQTWTQVDVDLYGRDAALPGCELSLGVLSILIDQLATVEGRFNIVQALTERIGTQEGELVLHPDYGIERRLCVGVEGTEANVALSGMEVARCVSEDPRVVQVSQVKTTLVGTTNTATMNVQVIGPGQRNLPLNVVLPDLVVTAP
jgi:hypothetical protein